MNRGFVKLPRDIVDSPFWPKTRKYTRLEALLDLRLSARWRPGKVQIGGHVIHVSKDGLLTSQVKLARRWRWSRKSVAKFFLALIMAKILLVETKRGIDHGYTLVTFINPSTFDPDDDPPIPMEDQEKVPIGVPIEGPYEKKGERSKQVGSNSMYRSQSDVESGSNGKDQDDVEGKEAGPGGVQNGDVPKKIAGSKNQTDDDEPVDYFDLGPQTLGEVRVLSKMSQQQLREIKNEMATDVPLAVALLKQLKPRPTKPERRETTDSDGFDWATGKQGKKRKRLRNASTSMREKKNKRTQSRGKR